MIQIIAAAILLVTVSKQLLNMQWGKYIDSPLFIGPNSTFIGYNFLIIALFR
jgi:hypothetical protein